MCSDKSHQSSGSGSSGFDQLLPNELSLTKLDDSSSIGYSLSGSETIKRHYQNLIRKYESIKEELETLRKRYSDLVGTHGAIVSKLELSQNEHFRLRKSFEDCCEQRNAAMHEKGVLQSQCTAAIRQWDKALREISELKEQLLKVQHQRDDTIKEINTVMAQRIKSTKDLARLTDERNAAVQEYSLIMSERDSVHKEIEKLQEEQSAMQKRMKSLENDKKVMSEEIESLKREIASALFDRDRVLKVCNDLREKYSDYSTGVNEDVSSPTSPSKAAHNFWGSSSSGFSSWTQMMPKGIQNEIKSNHMSAASSNSSVSTFSQQQNKLCSNTRLDNLDQANLEIEMLRKQVERLQTDLIEAQQEVEVCKRRRDWAFNERDKIVLERESIRTLCDKLRRERDRAVSDLAEALRDSDDIKRQRNEATKELKDLKEQKVTPIYSSVASQSASPQSTISASSVKNKSLDLRIYKPGKINSSLDYSVVSAQSRDKTLLEYYKNRAGVKQTRPHSIHKVLLSDISSALNATNLQINGDNACYDNFNPLQTSPPSSNVPIPPIRNSGANAYYAINTGNHPQNSILHVHNSQISNGSHITRNTPQPPIRHSSASSHSLLTPYISRSGDSLLSGNEHVLHTHDMTHSRSVSAYHGGVRPYPFKDNLVNRYSITPSPSPSQYSGGLFGNQSPSHSMEIGNSNNIQSKRLSAQHNAHQNHLYNNNGVYRSEESTFPMSSIDGLSTFPKRNQRIRIPSNPSVTSKSSCGKLSTSSIDNASSSILSDRGSPISFQIDWSHNESSNCSDVSNGNNRIAKPGDVRSIVIEKTSTLSAPLGIQIHENAKEKGGIFVSQVSNKSLASQVGLLVGDQLLEVCGINMRNANYLSAANVLNNIRNLGNITMLVHYNPGKYKEDCVRVQESDEGDDEDEDEDNDRGDTTSTSASTSTPQSSPIEHTAKPIVSRGNSNANEEENIPSSATSTLTRSKAASRSASNASRNTEKTITNSISERQSITSSSFKKQSNSGSEPRRIFVKKAASSLGISLFGGNAVGIFVYSVRDESLSSGANGLKPGDQILEYNGVDLRNATAEEAAIELAKPSEAVSIVAQYNKERYIEIQSQQGDSFYIRAAFDRPSIDGSLAFRKDDILFVDNTMFNGVPGLWRAWLIDQEGQKVKCGVIPSKYKVEEELLLRRSLSEGSGDKFGSVRRSFFRRRKNIHQRSSSRESTKELASFSDVSINSCSDSGAMTAEAIDQLLPATYLRVERLSYETSRPVIIMGPLMEVLFEKLEQEFPHFFQRCIPEVMRGSQQMMEKWLQDLKLVDYRRRGSHFECTTIAAVKEICDNDLHALLDVSPTSVERLIRCQIYPVVVFLKFKSAKQIKEIKDHRYTNEKLTSKAAKELYEYSLKIESEYKDLINIVIPGSNLTYMCTQVKTYVDDEQNKAHWVLS